MKAVKFLLKVAKEGQSPVQQDQNQVVTHFKV
jgi:hypothetical protein